MTQQAPIRVYRLRYLSNLTLEFPPEAADFNVVVLQARDGRPITSSHQLLLGVFTRMENTGMAWNEDETSVDDRWVDRAHVWKVVV